jgi:hypothetical protein
VKIITSAVKSRVVLRVVCRWRGGGRHKQFLHRKSSILVIHIIFFLTFGFTAYKENFVYFIKITMLHLLTIRFHCVGWFLRVKETYDRDPRFFCCRLIWVLTSFHSPPTSREGGGHWGRPKSYDNLVFSPYYSMILSCLFLFLLFCNVCYKFKLFFKGGFLAICLCANICP